MGVIKGDTRSLDYGSNVGKPASGLGASGFQKSAVIVAAS